MSRHPPDARKAPRCPICGQPPVREVRPFCSRRCRDLDLMHWLAGRYAVPAVEVDEDGREAHRRQNE